MDPQQELFSAVLMALKEKYEDTGVGVYDTDLPPEDTPYPFVYLADCSESDQATKNEIIGETNLMLKVWHDNVRQRGRKRRRWLCNSYCRTAGSSSICICRHSEDRSLRGREESSSFFDVRHRAEGR